MSILRFSKNADTKLSPHFNVSEFVCPCPQCTETVIDSALIDLLEKVREKAGPLKINSGYRCEHYQTELRLRGCHTSIGPSEHQFGRAADVAGANVEHSGSALEAFARESGFKAVGVARDWVHVDLRSDKERRWVYP